MEQVMTQQVQNHIHGQSLLPPRSIFGSPQMLIKATCQGYRAEERLFLENLSVRIAWSCMQQKSAQITFFSSCNKKARGRQSRLVQRLKETIKDRSSFYLPALLPFSVKERLCEACSMHQTWYQSLTCITSLNL